MLELCDGLGARLTALCEDRIRGRGLFARDRAGLAGLLQGFRAQDLAPFR